jgi:nicotinamidase-related amidase
MSETQEEDGQQLNEFPINDLNSINDSNNEETNATVSTTSENNQSNTIKTPIISSGLQKVHEVELGDSSRIKALLVVNVQNCFFKGGAMSMISSGDIKQDVMDEINLIRRINNLISLQEKDDDYFKAGLAGSPVLHGSIMETTDPNTGNKILKGTYSSGARKKHFFDHIIYSQNAYPPDSKAFASHHYLREKKGKMKNLMMQESISIDEASKQAHDDTLDKTYWSFVNSLFVNQGMLQYDTETNTKLLADHALIDGSDVIIEGNSCFRGIDLHPKLNLAPLFRPNQNIDPSTYIKKPELDGRGRIMWLQADETSLPNSCFFNNKNESTGLDTFLKDKGVTDIYIVGLFRDIMVEATAVDAKTAGFKNVKLVYDVTLPFNIPTNPTKVNNKFYFKNQGDITKYLEVSNKTTSETEFLDYLHENNQWAQELETKNVDIINYFNIVGDLKQEKEYLGCGIDKDDMIKTFDVYLETSTFSSK